MAKSLTMVQNNDIGKLSRKYFITIEKAFKNRIEWNLDRDLTIEMCKELKVSLGRYGAKLNLTKPYWLSNQYIAEFCLLNEIIIGMSAKEYRLANGLNKNTSIRNTFTEEQLEWVRAPSLTLIM